MKRAIEKILKAHGRLDEFNSNPEDGFHVRIENEPYMPLSIERHDSMVTVTHYFEQNGDLIPDPDMEFEICPDGLWIPIAIQQPIGGYSRVFETIDGVKYVRPKLMRELKSFSRMWSRKLLQQGFARGARSPA